MPTSQRRPIRRSLLVPGSCKVVARFAGDIDHIGSRVTKFIPC